MNRLRLAIFSLVTASTSAAQFLVAVDSAVSTIDSATGAKTPFATLSATVGVASGLAYDAATRTMYLSSSNINSLFRLDLATGTTTSVGSYGAGVILIHGLEFDSSTGRLYGASSGGSIYVIDRSTGSATSIGTSGLTGPINLGYDARNKVMYATNSNTDSLYRMNLATGTASLIGPLNGPTSPQGLAYDSDTGVMYLVDNSTDNLYSIDLGTGAATLIGTTGTGNLLGLAYLPRSEGGFTRIAHGCGPTTISAVGLPRRGHPIQLALGAVTGVPALGLGVTVAPLPFCGCTIGHDWTVALLASQLPLVVPAQASVVGLRLAFQGLDYLGSGGCPAPQLTLTDTIVATFG